MRPLKICEINIIFYFLSISVSHETIITSVEKERGSQLAKEKAVEGQKRNVTMYLSLSMKLSLNMYTYTEPTHGCII